MFFLNIIVAIIGYSIAEEKPVDSTSKLGFIAKFFTYQYGLYNRGFEACFNRFVTDIICLLIHGGILCALNFADNIHIIFQFLILEAVFYFSEFMMRIYPYSIKNKPDTWKTLFTYLIEVFLITTQFYIESSNTCIIITLSVHALLLVCLIARKLRRRKFVSLFNQAEQCLLINLKEDLNSSLNSNSDGNTQFYIIKYGKKIQLVSVGQPKMSMPDIQSQKQEKQNNDIVSIGMLPTHNVKNLPNLNLNEMNSCMPLQNQKQNSGEQKQIIFDDKQIMCDTREKQITISKLPVQQKYKSEDEPTTRKKTPTFHESLMLTITTNAGVTNSNHQMLNGISPIIYQNSTSIAQPLNNIKSNSQSQLQSNHQTTLSFNKPTDKKEDNPINKMKTSSTRSLTLDYENMNIDILNTLELEFESGDSSFELLSFHEKSQNVLIKTNSAVFFFSVPDFKKSKSILLDKNSKYIFHQTEPLCIQYHYSTINNQFQFTKLNLSLPKITKDDMKYNSLTMQNPKFEQNDLLFYAQFNFDSNQSKDILFIGDGPDLVAVNTESLSMENYSQKLPSEDGEKVQIQQLNKRQIVINSTSQNQLQKLVLDIPTNICCRKFTNLPINVEMISIENLQNQIILNNQKINKNPCVYDMNTEEFMELQDSKSIKKAWSLNKQLYIIDETDSIKIYNFQGTKFDLLPPGDSGIACVSIGFN